MPVLRVLNADLEAEVEKLEKLNRVVSVSESGDGAFVVVYEAKNTRRAPGERETR